MPKLSPTMEEGTIAKWHKKEGEFVHAGELLLEVATDKATVEHSALDEGWLRKIVISEGGSAVVNQPIAIFTEEEKESIEGYKLPEKELAPEQKQEESEAPAAQKPQEKQAGGLTQPAFTPEPPLPLEKKHPSPLPEGRIHASPLAKRLAEEKGLDLTTVTGSGPGGRITSEDLEKAQPKGVVTFGRRETPSLAPGSYEEIPLSPMRKVIARRLQESKTFIPHFYAKQEINAEPMIALREQLKTFDLKVTYNDLVLRAASLALRQHPEINSGFNSVNQSIIRFQTIDISVAVTVESGLITPIIRHADVKNLGELSSEVRALAAKARSGKLKEEEYKGGSFCISNLGMFGISEFTAVINPPQAAILAIGGIESKAVVRDGQVVPGHTLTLVLSVDHRVIDGADAAKFLKTLQHLLENPVSLTL